MKIKLHESEVKTILESLRNDDSMSAASVRYKLGEVTNHYLGHKIAIEKRDKYVKATIYSNNGDEVESFTHGYRCLAMSKAYRIIENLHNEE